MNSAQWLSTSCFLNSLLREWHDWKHVDQSIHIELKQHPEYAAIRIPLLRFSSVGRHRYAGTLYLEDRKGHQAPTTLQEMASLLLNEESIVGLVDERQKNIFLQRLADSQEMMQESLAHRQEAIGASFDRELSFREVEQLLIVGHSFHPTPKSRDEFTAADRLRYSPEMGGHFALSWIAVHPDFFVERRSEHFSHDWIQELIASDPVLKDQLHLQAPVGFRLLPMHPWQAEKLKQHPNLALAIKDGQISFLQAQGDDWHATSSLRSLYRQAAPYMLKFSLSLKLTNSVRHLLIHEVERGVQVYDVLKSTHGAKLLAEQPALHVICEPAYAALRGADGVVLHESIVVCRENPFQQASDPQPQVLATLTQEDPEGRGNLILQHIRSYAAAQNLSLTEASRVWFRAFCKVALEPLMVAQSNYGILLGAHQQNLLISLSEHLPDRLYFRDCQGTGYLEWAYERMRDEVRSFDLKNGNIISQDMAVYLFTYYLVVNSAFNVVAAIADSGAISEEELLGDLRALVQGLVDGKPFDNELLLDLLQEGTLMHKGNFHCSVQSINENTAKNPMAIYVPIKNPLV